MKEKESSGAVHRTVTDEPLLVFDFDDNPVLPPNFRRADHPFGWSSGVTPSRKGLNEIKASAAMQFSVSSLEITLQNLPAEVCVVDLRQEPHGFIDGRAVSWYGLKNWTYASSTDEALIQIERELVSRLNEAGAAKVHEIFHKTEGHIDEASFEVIPVTLAETEEEMLDRLGFRHHRFFVTDHHHPDPQTMDRFIHLLKTRPTDTWLHFHCRSGLGRASTFMVLSDIILNATEVSLEDIIQRHELLGSKNLFQVAESPDKLWRRHLGEERREFLREFYAYARSTEDLVSNPWSEWLLAREQT